MIFFKIISHHADFQQCKKKKKTNPAENKRKKKGCFKGNIRNEQAVDTAHMRPKRTPTLT